MLAVQRGRSLGAVVVESGPAQGVVASGSKRQSHWSPGSPGLCDGGSGWSPGPRLVGDNGSTLNVLQS